MEICRLCVYLLIFALARNLLSQFLRSYPGLPCSAINIILDLVCSYFLLNSNIRRHRRSVIIDRMWVGDVLLFQMTIELHRLPLGPDLANENGRALFGSTKRSVDGVEDKPAPKVSIIRPRCWLSRYQVTWRWYGSCALSKCHLRFGISMPYRSAHIWQAYFSDKRQKFPVSCPLTSLVSLKVATEATGNPFNSIIHCPLSEKQSRRRIIDKRVFGKLVVFK